MALSVFSGDAKELAGDHMTAITLAKEGNDARVISLDNKPDNSAVPRLLDVGILYPQLSLADIDTHPRIVSGQFGESDTDQDLYLIVQSSNPFKRGGDLKRTAIGAGAVMLPLDMQDAIIACSSQLCRTGHYHEVPDVKFIHVRGKAIFRYYEQYEDCDGQHTAARYLLVDGQRVSSVAPRDVVPACAEYGLDVEADFFDQTGLINIDAWMFL